MKLLHRRRLLQGTAVLAVCFILLQGGILLHARDTATGEEPYMVILGARLYGSAPSPALRNRLNKAAAYLLDHPEVMVVVSGGMGPGETTTEASAMAAFLVRQGIESHRILLEDRSVNTLENLRFSLERIQEVHPDALEGAPSVVVVTNGFHVLRSKMLARRLGMHPTALAAETPPTFVVKGYVRESLALVKSFLLDR